MTRAERTAPDLIEPIDGYRCWRYSVRNGVANLSSFMRHRWDGGNDWLGSWRGWVVASCGPPPGPHRAPEERCSCGFYAMSSVDDSLMISLERGPTAALERDGIVLGRVELAGKVIEHDRGYRAERARVAELIPTTGDRELVGWLAGLLDLPVGEELDTTAIEEELASRPGLDSYVWPASPGPGDRVMRKVHLRLIQLNRDDGAD